MNDGRACSRCGSAADTRQEYCLECGDRLVSERNAVHWLWPTAAAALVAASVATVAIAAGSGGEPPSTIVALTPLRAAPARSEAHDLSLARWPRRNGYTIVLAVVPTTKGEDEAVSQARRGARAGLPDVGVLTSSDYASLHPGDFIVFSGTYRALDQALVALPYARSRFRSAYVRQVAR